MTFIKGGNMVINDAFTFTNQVREYYLETKTTQYGEPCPPFSIIKSTGPARSIVYDFENHKALIEILSINSSDEQAIFNYISKYGWLFTEEDEVDHVNESFESAIDINDAAAIIASLQSIVNLISAFQTNNSIDMITNVVVLMLSEVWVDDYDLLYSSFNQYFYDQYRNLGYFGLSRSDSTELNLSKKIDYIVNLPDDERRVSWDRDPKFGQCLSLLNIINKVFNIDILAEHGRDAFCSNVSNCINSFPLDAYNLLNSICIYTLENEMNSVLNNINPCIKITFSRKVSGDWNIPDLLSALYLDIYLSYSSDKIFKKCSNPTCNQFFEVEPGNTRKKYCSTHCAQLMAKRKQREREKNKIKPDV